MCLIFFANGALFVRVLYVWVGLAVRLYCFLCISFIYGVADQLGVLASFLKANYLASPD
jgi:hypothetical protein